jgi:hypothetical protein
MNNSASKPVGEFDLLRHPRYEGQIVRPALKRDHVAAWVGFSLGQILWEDTQVRFDFALPAFRFHRLDGMDWREAGDLRRFFPSATAVAQHFEREVIGLWAAWTHTADMNERKEIERDSSLSGEAAALGLPFVSVTPIDGLCRWRGAWFSRLEDFPARSRRAKRTKGRPCPGPFDNPRRVKAAWRNQLETGQLPIP